MPQTIGEILGNAGELQQISESPKLDTEILLCHVLGQNRAYLYTHPNLPVSPVQQAVFTALLKRRLAGEPVAYLTGHQGFWHVDLAVDSRVLVPRPDTELLIEMALGIDSEQVTSVADLGTGSGAIAIALARERPSWQLSATDISPDALVIARRNAHINGVDIKFYQGNWFAALPLKRFDLVISNPPYIDPTDPHLLDRTLCYEPVTALIAKDKGLADLRQIIAEAKQHLNKQGWIILEHGYDQSFEVCAMLHDYGYTSIQSRRDIAGHDRAAMAQVTNKS